jgi:nanoRNase/pAp phosphatase (c-di-AMP/oligoRNAs hydrolase)
MLARHDVSVEEVEGLIDIIRRTAEADVACVLKEEPNGTVKVSLRSVGAADVRHIAAAHGGGGHRFAGGFTSETGIDETVDRIRAALSRPEGSTAGMSAAATPRTLGRMGSGAWPERPGPKGQERA